MEDYRTRRERSKEDRHIQKEHERGVRRVQRNESRQERRIQRKRDEIVDAATRVFAQKGFAIATTKDIADEADMGESTLYNYFDSKRDILLAIIDENHVAVDAMLREVGDVPDRDALVALVDRCLDMFISKTPFTRTILLEAWMDDNILLTYVMPRIKRIHKLIRDFLDERIKSGVIRPINPDLGARLAMGMFMSLAGPVLRGAEPAPSPAERHELAEAMVSLLLDGLRPRDKKSSVE